jgi:hypothetical protein
MQKIKKNNYKYIYLSVGSLLLLYFLIVSYGTYKLQQYFQQSFEDNHFIKIKGSKISYQTASVYGFPFYIGAKIEGYKEDLNTHTTEAKAPIYLRFNPINVNLYIKYKGDAVVTYKNKAKEGRIFTGKLKYSLDFDENYVQVLKTIMSGKIFELINFLDAIKFELFEGIVVDAFSKKKLQEIVNYKIQVNILGKPQYYASYEDVFKNMPRRLSGTLSIRSLLSQKERVLPVSAIWADVPSSVINTSVGFDYKSSHYNIYNMIPPSFVNASILENRIDGSSYKGHMGFNINYENNTITRKKNCKILGKIDLQIHKEGYSFLKEKFANAYDYFQKNLNKGKDLKINLKENNKANPYLYKRFLNAQIIENFDNKKNFINLVPKFHLDKYTQLNFDLKCEAMPSGVFNIDVNEIRFANGLEEFFINGLFKLFISNVNFTNKTSLDDLKQKINVETKGFVRMTNYKTLIDKFVAYLNRTSLLQLIYKDVNPGFITNSVKKIALNLSDYKKEAKDDIALSFDINTKDDYYRIGGLGIEDIKKEISDSIVSERMQREENQRGMIKAKSLKKEFNMSTTNPMLNEKLLNQIQQ